MRNQMYLLVILLAAALLTSCNAFAAKAPRRVKRSVVRKEVVRRDAVPVVDNRLVEPTYRDYPVPQYVSEGRSAPAKLAVTAPGFPPPRFVHVRLQTVPLVEWMSQEETLASLRGDVDLIVSEKVSFGPSVLYQRRSVIDTTALAAGQSVGLDTSRLELGLVGNLYVHGTASAGGFLFRPHVYYVIPSGERDTSTGSAAGVGTNGVRTGVEFLFQKVLDVGFSFEIGGGFTYHVVPWEVTHAGAAPGLQRVGPENLFVPTVTVGVGWAF